MKKVLKVILQIILALLILTLILAFLAFSAKSEIVPDIYVTSDSGKVALAIRGGYKWTSFSQSVVADSISFEEFAYENNNILLVNPGEKMTLRNSDNPLERYKFYQLDMKYYDEFDKQYIVPSVEKSKAYTGLDYLELNAPQNEGTYIYNFKLSYYNKGEVEYGLKVVVSTEPNYEITELINFRNTQITDAQTVNQILNLLPYSKYKKGMILKSNSMQNELLINYEEFAMDRDDLTNNVIALFTLIPDLDVITYKSTTEMFYFTRFEIENLIGRELTDYADNIELWRKEILFKEKIADEIVCRDTIYKSIIADVISEYQPEEIKAILVDTQSFKESDILEISEVDAREIVEYALQFSDIVYDVSYNEYKESKYEGVCISLVDIKDKVAAITEELSGDYFASGDNINENKIDYNLYKDIYVITVIVSNNEISKLYKYEINYNNTKWNIMDLDY